MANLSRCVIAPLFACVVAATTLHAQPQTAPSHGLLAHYQVSRDGQTMGTATLTLQPAGAGEYHFRSQIQGSAGLAALLAASIDEQSEFRWQHGVPETTRYQYQMQTAFKRRQRQLQVNWQSQRVDVDEGKAITHYPSQPGMVDHNLLLPTIGWRLQGALPTTLAIPVAVRQTVETEHFKVRKDGKLRVPAGQFKVTRVERSDQGKALIAWYAPTQLPLPVKISQQEGGNLTMQLIDFKPL